MENLSGKVAIVTGASGGIGRAIAVKLAMCGANIIINYRNNKEGALRTLEEVKKYAPAGIIIKCDIKSYEDCKKMMDTAIEKMGKVDILVNNAGLSYIGVFMDMQQDQWNNMIDVDLKGVINCTHCALKHMACRKSGVIVNISSIWGNIGASCEAVYSAAKGAVISFTKAIAKEMGPSNIRINAVSPGVIDTDMNSWLSDQEKKNLMDEIPIGRFGKAEDIANVVAFLCSDSSEYITAQVITADGGML